MCRDPAPAQQVGSQVVDALVDIPAVHIAQPLRRRQLASPHEEVGERQVQQLNIGHLAVGQNGQGPLAADVLQRNTTYSISTASSEVSPSSDRR